MLVGHIRHRTHPSQDTSVGQPVLRSRLKVHAGVVMRGINVQGTCWAGARPAGTVATDRDMTRPAGQGAGWGISCADGLQLGRGELHGVVDGVKAADWEDTLEPVSAVYTTMSTMPS